MDCHKEGRSLVQQAYLEYLNTAVVTSYRRINCGVSCVNYWNGNWPTFIAFHRLCSVQ